MNRYISIATLLTASTLMLGGCSQEDIDTYSGDDAIFFAQQWGVAHFANNIAPNGGNKNCHQAYSKIPFGMMDKTDSLLLLNVQTLGYVRDYDRPFGIEIVADSTTAVEGPDFELVNPEADAVIRAGQSNALIRIQFHKTEHMEDGLVQLQLRLVPGEHFILPFDKYGFGKMPIISESNQLNEFNNLNLDPSVHNIFMNNVVSKPPNWNAYLLGDWSEQKFRIILDLTHEELGWTVSTWDNTNLMWSGGRYRNVQTLLGKYLLEQYDKGREHWLLDPDGTMMWTNGAGLSWDEDSRPEYM